MKVFVTSAYPEPEPNARSQPPEPITTFQRMAQSARRHSVADSPESADAILFIENSRYHNDPFFWHLKHHPLVSQFRQRVFMYNEHDTPWLVLPGLYCSMRKRWFDPKAQMATRYIRLLNPVDVETNGEEDLLFSFMGQARTRLRQRIALLKHPRGVLEDTSKFDAFFAVGKQDNHLRYADVLRRSKFVVCPKGVGTSSIRLFECLRAGRVPIIVSDQWVEPEGPEWAKFSIRVAENAIESIPEVAERAESQWPEMSRLAKDAWARYFADEVFFDRVGDNLQTLMERGGSAKRGITVPGVYWRVRMSAHLIASGRVGELIHRAARQAG